MHGFALCSPFDATTTANTDLWRELYKDRFFYQLYFLNEGIAEAEFETDVAESCSGIHRH